MTKKTDNVKEQGIQAAMDGLLREANRVEGSVDEAFVRKVMDAVSATRIEDHFSTPIRTHRSWAVLVTLAAASVVAVFGVWHWLGSSGFGTGPVTGSVAETRGDVAGGHGGARLKTGDVLRPGDSVHTGTDGYLKFIYRDRSVVEVGANANMTLIAGKDPFAKLLRLEKGALTTNIRKQPNDRRMSITTPHGVATVVGTTFRLIVTAQTTELSVQTGTVEFASMGESKMVAAGESETVETGSLYAWFDRLERTGVLAVHQGMQGVRVPLKLPTMTGREDAVHRAAADLKEGDPVKVTYVRRWNDGTTRSRERFVWDISYQFHGRDVSAGTNQSAGVNQ